MCDSTVRVHPSPTALKLDLSATNLQRQRVWLKVGRVYKHGKEQDFSLFILQVEECIDTDGAKLMDAKNLLSFIFRC